MKASLASIILDFRDSCLDLIVDISGKHQEELS